MRNFFIYGKYSNDDYSKIPPRHWLNGTITNTFFLKSDEMVELYNKNVFHNFDELDDKMPSSSVNSSTPSDYTMVNEERDNYDSISAQMHFFTFNNELKYHYLYKFVFVESGYKSPSDFIINFSDIEDRDSITPDFSETCEKSEKLSTAFLRSMAAHKPDVKSLSLAARSSIDNKWMRAKFANENQFLQPGFFQDVLFIDCQNRKESIENKHIVLLDSRFTKLNIVKNFRCKGIEGLQAILGNYILRPNTIRDSLLYGDLASSSKEKHQWRGILKENGYIASEYILTSADSNFKRLISLSKYYTSNNNDIIGSILTPGTTPKSDNISKSYRQNDTTSKYTPKSTKPTSKHQLTHKDNQSSDENDEIGTDNITKIKSKSSSMARNQTSSKPSKTNSRTSQSYEVISFDTEEEATSSKIQNIRPVTNYSDPHMEEDQEDTSSKNTNRARTSKSDSEDENQESVIPKRKQLHPKRKYKMPNDDDCEEEENSIRKTNTTRIATGCATANVKSSSEDDLQNEENQEEEEEEDEEEEDEEEEDEEEEDEEEEDEEEKEEEDASASTSTRANPNSTTNTVTTSQEKISTEYDQIENGLYKCRLCDYKPNYKSIIVRHMNKHKRKSYTCLQCQKVYQSQKGINDHIMLVHEPKTIPCEDPLCTTMFSNKSALNKHMKTTHNNFQLLCPIEGCGSILKLHSSVKRHILNIHERTLHPIPILEIPEPNYEFLEATVPYLYDYENSSFNASELKCMDEHNDDDFDDEDVDNDDINNTSNEQTVARIPTIVGHYVIVFKLSNSNSNKTLHIVKVGQSQ